MFAYHPRRGLPFGCLSIVAAFALPITSFPALAASRGSAKARLSAGGQLWQPWFQLGGYALDRERGEGELWAPLFQDHGQVLFAELKGKLFEDDVREGNFALGYRSKAGTDWVLGAWTGYDIRQSEQNNTFHQIAGGFEALSHNWDLRANWYVPINRSEVTFSDLRSVTTTTTTSTAALDNGGLSVFNTSTSVTSITGNIHKERALYGVDAEIGMRIPLDDMFASDRSVDSWWKKNELRVYAGGYYFDSPEADQAIYGPRIRAEWRINDVIPDIAGSRLSFEAAYQYDKVRSDQFEVGARLRLPFGGHGWGNPAYRTLTYQEKRMSDSIERDTDIVAKKRTSKYRAAQSQVKYSRERALDDETGTQFDRAVIVDGGSNLNHALAQAGGNSLVIASARKGAFVNQYVTMQDNQTLMSTGSAIVVRGSKTGNRAVFYAAGQRATIKQTTNNEVVLVGSNNHITGFNIEGGGAGAGHYNRGIATFDRYQENIVIDNMKIRNTDGHGIRFDSAINNWTVRDTSISGITDGNGIDVEDRNKNFKISNVQFSDISLRSGDGIHLSGANTGEISNNTFGENIADSLIRMKKDNQLSGTGNLRLGDNEIYQFFGANNELDISFDLNVN